MKRARRLTTIAKWINENCPELFASCQQWTTSTDRKPKGLRYITHKGKGRKGYRLDVYKRTVKESFLTSSRNLAFSLNNSEPYRTNQEAEDWLSVYLEKRDDSTFVARWSKVIRNL